MSVIEYQYATYSIRFPKTMMNGCNRRFNPACVSENSWLHYTRECDCVFCRAGALFGPSEVSTFKLGLFISTPFPRWTKKSQ